MTDTGHTVAKAWRYLRLYGPARTLSKVRARQALAAGAIRVERSPRPGQHIGIIGCGNFALATIAHYLPRGSIRATMDVDPAHAAALARVHVAAYSTTDAARLLADPAIDLIFIASNHASHADHAARALGAGKHVHIEKSHVVGEAQLGPLCAAMAARPDLAVNIGFNRPHASLFIRAAQALAREDGPTMIAWFVAGHAIPPGHWYDAPGEGGRVLGNLSHWIDASRALINPSRRYPITLTPAPTSEASGNLGLTLDFSDGSTAMIAFSVKVEPFEGVRERLHAHRGATLIDIEDFARLTITRGPARAVYRSRWHDHGHCATIRASLEGARTGRGLSIAEVRERGELILAAARAIETGTVQTVHALAE